MLPTRLPKPCGGQGRKIEDEIEDEDEDDKRAEPDSHRQGSGSVRPGGLQSVRGAGII